MCVNLLLIQKATSKYVFGVKSYTWIFNCVGVGTLIPMLFKGRLYIQFTSSL